MTIGHSSVAFKITCIDSDILDKISRETFSKGRHSISSNLTQTLILLFIEHSITFACRLYNKSSRLVRSIMASRIKCKALRQSNTESFELLIEDSPIQHRQGLWPFIRNNSTAPLALTTGIIGNASVILFTFWLSKQILECPDWTVNCAISREVQWIKNNIGAIQGFATFLYDLSLAALAFASHTLAEAAIWPLLSKQSFKLHQIEKYLSASRGSVPSLPGALSAIKTLDTALLLVVTAIATLISISTAPLVGHDYELQNTTVQYESTYVPGGGEGQIFAQRNPPTSLQAEAMSQYTSWANNLSSEPMPDYRDWWVDRETLSVRGNMSVNAVNLRKRITCQGYNVQESGTVKNGRYTFKTNIASHNDGIRAKNSSDDVTVHAYSQLATWVYDFVFRSANRTSSTLIFAAINGTIQNGSWTKVSEYNSISGVSAVACNVDVEFVDGRLTVGTAPETAAKLSSVDTISSGHSNSSSPSTDKYANTLNEVALWLAVAPTLCSISVDGTQPMFVSNGGWLPDPHTSSASNSNQWTVDDIENFINVSMGVYGQVTSLEWKKTPVKLASMAITRKLDSSRPYFLLIPHLTIVIATGFLAYWTNQLHRQHKIPVMRLANLSDVLKSSQTPYVLERAKVDAGNAYRPSRLGELNVRYGVSPTGMIGLSNCDSVVNF
jgi:hypothetical protein